jgi:uncharacterized protein YndB with AHSA1/START domain
LYKKFVVDLTPARNGRGEDAPMTTATDRTQTQQDFETTRELAAPSEAVMAALGSPEAITSWWSPTTGSSRPGGTLATTSHSGSRMLDMQVEQFDAGRVVWRVLQAPLTPEWVGTTLDFSVQEVGDGATLHFRHHGLTPACECFAMCHEGWTNALDRLYAYVETGRPSDEAASFQSTLPVAAAPDTVLSALRTPQAVASWWGTASGSAEVGGTLVVSFLGGRQRIVLDVVPTPFAHRVVWAVREAPLTPEWDGTTIYFDVEAADDEAGEAGGAVGATGGGATIHFRHVGLTPRLECFAMCHEGWTHYLASLVSYVETGRGQPSVED